MKKTTVVFRGPGEHGIGTLEDIVETRGQVIDRQMDKILELRKRIEELEALESKNIELKGIVRKVDRMLSENVIDFINGDIDWHSPESLGEVIRKASNKNEDILNFLRGEK